MDFNIQPGQLAKNGLRVTMLAAAVAVASCGGGGSSSSVGNAGNNPGTSVPVSANKVYLTTENTAFDTKGGQIVVQARAIDVSGGAIVGQTVKFSLTDPSKTGVVINQESEVVTDESGVARVTLLLPPNTTQAKLNYLINTGTELVAQFTDTTKKVATDKLTIKAQDGGGTSINKIEKYDIAISSNKLELATGRSTADVVVTVTDKNGGLIQGAPVILSLTDPSSTGVTLNVPSSQVTDDKGQVVFSINQANSKLNYRLNHTVNLSVLVDDGEFLPALQELAIPVTGTTLLLSSDSTIISAATTNVAVVATLRDGENAPIANSKVELLNTNGAVLLTGTTTSAGTIAFQVPVANLNVDANGQVRLSARAYGSTDVLSQEATSILTLITRDGEFVFESLPTSETAINQPATVKIQVKSALQSDLTGKTIRLSSSLGTVDASQKAITNIRKVGEVFVGDATFAITSSSPGVANLQATFGADSIRAQTEFVSPVATKISVQSSPSVVSPRGTSAIVVRLTDANDAPVKNQLVQFNLLQDSSGGQVVNPEAVTNANGEATVNYTAGNLNTAKNGVRVQATSGNLVASTYLTVAARAVTIAIGNSNKISSSDNHTFYNMNVSANVVDNVGQPIANQAIAVRIIPTTYRKAQFEFDSIRVPPYDSESNNGVNIMNYDSRWYYTKGQHFASDTDRNLDPVTNNPIVIPNVTDDEGFIYLNDHFYTRPYECIAEDVNGNGFLDIGEDTNSNNKLDGVNVVTLMGYSPDSSGVYTLRTDNAGKFDFNIRYLKRYAQWLSIRIEASTIVQGSEAFGSVPITLPVLADDIDLTGQIDRPNSLSPYGINPCNMDE